MLIENASNHRHIDFGSAMHIAYEYTEPEEEGAYFQPLTRC